MVNEKVTIEITLAECKFLQKLCKDYKDAVELKGKMFGAMMASMTGIEPNKDSKGLLTNIIDGTQKSYMDSEQENVKTAQDLASIFKDKIYEAHLESATAGGKS